MLRNTSWITRRTDDGSGLVLTEDEGWSVAREAESLLLQTAEQERAIDESAEVGQDARGPDRQQVAEMNLPPADA